MRSYLAENKVRFRKGEKIVTKRRKEEEEKGRGGKYLRAREKGSMWPSTSQRHTESLRRSKANVRSPFPYPIT
jgi:hypothetical protein